jgi:hypothetical protein
MSAQTQAGARNKTIMDPITIREYSSPRAFHFSEVDWHSSVFVLNSFGGMFLGNAIDLVFLGTDYVNLPSTLPGLSISQPCDDAAVSVEKEFGIERKLEHPEGKRVFVIESEKQYQVIAAKMWIVVRTHRPELSLKPLWGENDNERRQFISEHVKEWYRMSAL